MLRIRFASEAKERPSVPWEEFPVNMPLTAYHLAEVLEQKFLVRTVNRRKEVMLESDAKEERRREMKRESGFVLSFEYDDDPPSTRPRITLYNCLKPWFDKFDVKPSFVLVIGRFCTSDRWAVFRERFGSNWLRTFRHRFSSYEVDTNHADEKYEIVLTTDSKDNEEAAMQTVIEHEVARQAVRYRHSYLIPYFLIKELRLKAKEESKEKGFVTLSGRICARMHPEEGIPKGTLRVDLIDVQSKKATSITDEVMRKLIVYTDLERPGKQYIMKRAII